jgi:hypothetical protein
MSKRIVTSFLALVFCAVMATGSAWAQGRGHGRGMSAANSGWRSNDMDRDMWGSRDWRGDRDRWTFGSNDRPRGWDMGKKTGWGDCDVPPGQAKKVGCSPNSRVFRGSSHHSHDRDRDRDRDRRESDRRRR